MPAGLPVSLVSSVATKIYVEIFLRLLVNTPDSPVKADDDRD